MFLIIILFSWFQLLPLSTLILYPDPLSNSAPWKSHIKQNHFIPLLIKIPDQLLINNPWNYPCSFHNILSLENFTLYILLFSLNVDATSSGGGPWPLYLIARFIISYFSLFSSQYLQNIPLFYYLFYLSLFTKSYLKLYFKNLQWFWMTNK